MFEREITLNEFDVPLASSLTMFNPSRIDSVALAFLARYNQGLPVSTREIMS